MVWMEWLFFFFFIVYNFKKKNIFILKVAKVFHVKPADWTSELECVHVTAGGGAFRRDS